MYFTVGQGLFADSMRWMFWTGLLITAVDVLVAIALANYGAKSAAKTQMLEANGVLALAARSPGSARPAPGSTTNRW